MTGDNPTKRINPIPPAAPPALTVPAPGWSPQDWVNWGTVHWPFLPRPKP